MVEINSLKDNVKLIRFLTISALILAVLPWLGFLLILLFRNIVFVINMLRDIELAIFSLGGWAWLAPICLAVGALWLAILQKHKNLIAGIVFTLIFIVVAGFAWLALMSLSTNIAP